jgi:RNA polymerase sigma-70 factor (ECF subfamily)
MQTQAMLPLDSSDGLAVSVSVESISMPDLGPSPTLPAGADIQSLDWLRRLRAEGPEHDQALSDLRDLLLRAARFEVHRRRAAMPYLRGNDYDDLAQQSADDALVSILAKLDSFRGESRFTTWAYKFALLEAAVKLRRRAWQGREIPRDAAQWSVILDPRAMPDHDAQTAELLRAVRTAIEQELTVHQREILVALTLDDVSIDVLAERLNSSRGALYKTLHDARRKLRGCLSAQGLRVGPLGERQIS